MPKTEKQFDVLINVQMEYISSTNATTSKEAVEKVREAYNDSSMPLHLDLQKQTVSFAHSEEPLNTFEEEYCTCESPFAESQSGLSRLAYIGAAIADTNYDLRVDISSSETFKLRHAITLLCNDEVVLFVTYDEDAAIVDTDNSITNNVCELVLDTVFKRNQV